MKLINELNNIINEKKHIGKMKKYVNFINNNEDELINELIANSLDDTLYISSNSTFLKTVNLLFGHDDQLDEIWAVTKYSHKEINEMIDLQIKSLKLQQEKLNLNGAKK